MATLEENQAFIQSILKQADDRLELVPGTALFDFLVRMMAIIRTFRDDAFEDILSKINLIDILNSPSPDLDIAAKILGNFDIVLSAGSPGFGTLLLRVQDTASIRVDPEVTFSSGAITFRTDRIFIGVKNPANLLEDTPTAKYRLLKDIGDGLLGLTVPVFTDTPTATAISRGTLVNISPRDPLVSSVEVAQSFTGGENPEDTVDAIRKAIDEITVKILSGADQIKSFIGTETGIPVFSASVIGFGDPEMRRNSSNLLGIGQGGMVDIYPRTAKAFTDIEVEAVAENIGNDRWRAIFAKTDEFTIIQVLRIRLEDQEQQADVSELIYNINADLSNEINPPIIPADRFSVNTAFQRVQIEFSFSAGEDPTKTFQFDIQTVPGIADLQERVREDSVRNHKADLLVIAPHPVSVAVIVTVRFGPASPGITESDVVQLVSGAINELPLISNILYGSFITREIQGAFPFVRVDLPIILEIPENPEQSFTGRTMAFFCDPANVTVNLVEDTTL